MTTYHDVTFKILAYKILLTCDMYHDIQLYFYSHFQSTLLFVLAEGGMQARRVVAMATYFKGTSHLQIWPNIF